MIRSISFLYFFILLTASGCSNLIGQEADYKTFQIEIDSLNVSYTASSDALEIAFWGGPLGPNGCYRFSHFDTTRIATNNSTTLQVRLWGKVPTTPQFCPGFSPPLRETLKLSPVSIGNWMIQVFQPDQSYLSEGVLIGR